MKVPHLNLQEQSINMLFFHKMVYKQIVFTHSYLIICIQTVKDARCKTKIRFTCPKYDFFLKRTESMFWCTPWCSCHYGSFHVEYVENSSYNDFNSWCETDTIGIAQCLRLMHLANDINPRRELLIKLNEVCTKYKIM